MFDVLIFSENGMAMISAADKEVGLKIRVTNKGGEDAHYTQLLATLPESLSYASYTSKEKSVSQQAGSAHCHHPACHFLSGSYLL